jgi:hypothetical protein
MKQYSYFKPSSEHIKIWATGRSYRNHNIFFNLLTHKADPVPHQNLILDHLKTMNDTTALEFIRMILLDERIKVSANNYAMVRYMCAHHLKIHTEMFFNRENCEMNVYVVSRVSVKMTSTCQSDR